MYLSKLDIIGFKSFANKTNLRFTDGVSAIVGPNGCGKSNIVDAIRWVLGEQKTSILRSDVMENVIFNGTKNRKPVGMAEVALTIENNKNILPSEYSEVVITRRLFRSGESEYLLNNTKCRLRDIIDLFMDTGLGSDSYSVIELKMVEAILSGRGEDRRSLFEEAAGIKKYKIQRKEATKRLNDVTADLMRVNDLIDEVRKNANSLQRHAQKTRRYNTLNEEFRNIDSKLSLFQYKNFNQIATALQSEIQLINEGKLKLETTLSEKNVSLNQIKSNHQNTENELNSLLENEAKLERNINQNKQDIAVTNERIIRVANDAIRFSQDIETTQNKLSNTLVGLQSTSEQIAKLNVELEESNATFIEVQTKVNAARGNTSQARNEVNKLSQQLQSINSSIDANINNVTRITNKKSALQNKIIQFNNEKNQLQNEIDRIDSELIHIDTNLVPYSNALMEKENHLTAQRNKQKELETQFDSFKEQLSAKKNELNQKQASWNFLHNLVDTSETSKFLYSHKLAGDYEMVTLSESIAADANLQSALSVIFSNFTDYYILPEFANSQSAIDLLKQNNKGKAGFISLDSIPPANPPEMIESSGVVGWFSEIIRADDNIRNAIRLLFEGLLVVDSLEAGRNILTQNPNVKAIISLGGEFLHKSGSIFGGSIKQGEGARFGKIEKMNNLKKEINELNILIDELNKQKNEIEKQLSEIDLQAIVNQIRTIENEKKSLENHLQQFKLNKTQKQNNFELLEKNCVTYQNDITDLDNEIKDILAGNEENKQNVAKLETDLLRSKNQLAEFESKQNEIENQSRNIELSQVKINGEINSSSNEQKRLKQQEQNYRNSIENHKLELINNSRLDEELKNKIEAFSAAEKELKSSLDELKIKSDLIVEHKKMLKEQLEDIERELDNYRKQHDRIVENIHQKEIKLSESNTWIRNIVINFQNNYQTDLTEDTEIEIPDDFVEEEAKSLLSDLKQKLQSLGSINFAAIEEYEVEKTRLDFLENQVADLVESEQTLRESIEEINRTAERNFIATFSQVKLNFQNLFRKLFNEEGEADITFDENNPLGSDINITARPPNKRPSNIEQLSGGEKTLTAISLLFAIYLVKPSPFCILDEVDAPLDDNNVRRFLNLIKDFSVNTQFLIVTHNKTTMAAADTLYGVTMQEPGVSKTASVRLEEIE